MVIEHSKKQRTRFVMESEAMGSHDSVLNTLIDDKILEIEDKTDVFSPGRADAGQVLRYHA